MAGDFPTPHLSSSPSDRERVEFRDSNMVLLYLVGEARSLLLVVLDQKRGFELSFGEMGVFRGPSPFLVLDPQLSLYNGNYCPVTQPLDSRAATVLYCAPK